MQARKAPACAARSFQALALALLLVPAFPLAASAQESGFVRWRGVVERDATLRFRGDGVQRVGGDEADDRVTASDPLPASEVLVYVRPLRGRALVSVDEQPS